jgi:hypothetical protein
VPVSSPSTRTWAYTLKTQLNLDTVTGYQVRWLGSQGFHIQLSLQDTQYNQTQPRLTLLFAAHASRSCALCAIWTRIRPCLISGTTLGPGSQHTQCQSYFILSLSEKAWYKSCTSVLLLWTEVYKRLYHEIIEELGLKRRVKLRLGCICLSHSSFTTTDQHSSEFRRNLSNSFRDQIFRWTGMIS